MPTLTRTSQPFNDIPTRVRRLLHPQVPRSSLDRVDKTLKDITSTQLDSGNYKRVCVKRKGRQRIPSLSTSDCLPTTSGISLSTTSAEVAEFSPASLHMSTNATPSREPTAPPSSAPISPKDVTSTEDAPTCQSYTEGAIETESGLKASLATLSEHM